MTDKTVIIVTHRPAALKLCDRQIAFGESSAGSMKAAKCEEAYLG